MKTIHLNGTTDMIARHEMRTMSGMNMTDAKCYECGRIFDLLNDADADKWHNGHKCKGKK